MNSHFIEKKIIFSGIFTFDFSRCLDSKLKSSESSAMFEKFEFDFQEQIFLGFSDTVWHKIDLTTYGLHRDHPQSWEQGFNLVLINEGVELKHDKTFNPQIDLIGTWFSMSHLRVKVIWPCRGAQKCRRVWLVARGEEIFKGGLHWACCEKKLAPLSPIFNGERKRVKNRDKQAYSIRSDFNQNPFLVEISFYTSIMFV